MAVHWEWEERPDMMGCPTQYTGSALAADGRIFQWRFFTEPYEHDPRYVNVMVEKGDVLIDEAIDHYEEMEMV